jgi:hypothetical protein
MNKIKKRYRHAREINYAIDRYKLKAQKLRDSASALDMQADEMIKPQNSGRWNREQITFNREQAKKKRQAAGRIEERTLSKLKEKLAEWQTDLLPGVITDGDRSIPARLR